MKNCTGMRCVMQVGTVDPATCSCVSTCPQATPPRTNADRIRAMTDEELSEFINDVEAEAIKRAGRFLTKIEIQRGKSQRLAWLKQGADT